MESTFASGSIAAPAFWQRRFYDFNVWTEKKLKEKLHYMHRNPVDRKLFLRVYSDHDSVGENPIRTSAPAFLIGALAIDFLAMSDAKDQHDQAVVVDLTDQPEIAHAVFPELPKS